jgi:hypothetical protein
MYDKVVTLAKTNLMERTHMCSRGSVSYKVHVCSYNCFTKNSQGKPNKNVLKEYFNILNP